MSSTNRSQARKQHVADYYVTPVNKIINFLKEFIKYEPNAFDGYILDPCAGGDTKNEMSYPKALEKIGIHRDNIITVDIRKDSKADIRENYLSIKCSGDFKTIITNPPFNTARKIIEKALNDVNHNGWVIMLLRLNYFGGKLRKDFWEKQMPKYCFIHHRRMGFMPENPNKTDSIEYAHMCFQKGYHPEFTKVKVI